jgi:ATP-dependent exoDNAse (exonuclease V) beta subunit
MPKFEPVQIIQALAGSGKTQLLAYRFIRLMQLGVDPESILATTFSRKAAGEIRDRIVEMLAEAILEEDKLAELRREVPEITCLEDCVLLLEKLIAALHRLNIGTIDSFFVKTALAFSDLLEFTQGWSILDEVHEDQVFSDAVSRLTKEKNKTEEMATTLRLSKSGAKVPVCKTIDDISSSAFYKVRGVNEGVWKWGTKHSVLTQDEVDKYIDDAESLDLEKKSQRTALTKAVLAMRKGDWKAFLTAGMAPKIIEGSTTYSRAELDTRIAGKYAPLINHGLKVMANRLLDKNVNTFKLMSELQSCWMEAKHERGLYSFDDVTYQLGESGAVDCLDDERLLELQFRMDGAINHLLVDEFQDTSLTQWGVLQPIVQEINQEFQNEERSLFFVGDVKQSLYGFRGGEPALLRGLENELQSAQTRRLEASWRCTPPVLEAVNTVFDGVAHSQLLSDHSSDAAQTWLNDFVKHESAPPTKKKKGYAVVQTAGADSSKTSLQLCIEKVVEVVSKMHSEAPAASIGILVRGNTKQQIQRIVQALRTNDTPVPASEFGGNPLTDSPAVTVILSALLLADDSGNSVHEFHVKQSQLGEYIKEFDGGLIRKQLLKGGYAKLINEYAEQLTEHVDERERLRLWQLVEFAEEYASEKTLRPSDFVRLVEETQVLDPASSQVQVMTIHKSKGLSFDAVVVCDLDSSLWKTPDTMEWHDNQPCTNPTRVGMYTSDYLDEIIPEYQPMREESQRGQVNDALCLLYVAMTRAKHALHLIIPSSESATKHYKQLSGLILQTLGEDHQQPPNNDKLWIAEGSDSSWVDSFKKKEDESVKSISEFTISPPSDPTKVGRGLATTSPSSLEGGGKTKVDERFKGGTNTAFDWGTVVHKWFEDIEWFDGKVPTVDNLIASAPCEEGGRLGNDKLILAAKTCSSALQEESFQHLLSKPDGNVVVYREQDFVLRVEKGTSFVEVDIKEPTDIRGTIDRLVVYKDSNGNVVRAEVIDWKTDKLESGKTVDDLVSNYAPQLASYRLAAARLLDIDISSVTAILALISEKKILDITEKACFVAKTDK